MINRYSNENFLAAEIALPILLEHFSSDQSYRKPGSQDLQWEWQEDNESWRPYPSHLNKRLEQARKNNGSTVYFCLGGNKYELDFNALHQRNTHTGRVRKIRFKRAAKLASSSREDTTRMSFNWPTLSGLLTTIAKEKSGSAEPSRGASSLTDKVVSKISEATKALRESLKIPPESVNDHSDEGKRSVALLSKLLAMHIRPCSIASSTMGSAGAMGLYKEETGSISKLSWKLSCSRLDYFLKNGVTEGFWESFGAVVSDDSCKPLSVIPHGFEEAHFYKQLTELSIKYAAQARLKKLKDWKSTTRSVVRFLLGQGTPSCHFKAVNLLLKRDGDEKESYSKTFDDLPILDIVKQWRETMRNDGQQILRTAWDYHLFRAPNKDAQGDNLPEVHCCTDGTYIYILSHQWGLIKVGTGENGTVCGQVVKQNQAMWVHGECSMTFITENIGTKEKKTRFLIIRSNFITSKLLTVDPETLLFMAHSINLVDSESSREREQEDLKNLNLSPIVNFSIEKPPRGLYVDARRGSQWVPAQITEVMSKDMVKLHFDNPEYVNFSDNYSTRDIAPLGTHVAVLPYLCANRPFRSELDLTHEAIYKANFSKSPPWLTPYVKRQIYDRILTKNWTIGSKIILPVGGSITFNSKKIVYVDEKGRETALTLASKVVSRPIYYDPIKSEVLVMKKKKGDQKDNVWVVVTKAGLNIRRGPSVNIAKMRENDWLKPNERVVALEIRNDWVRHSRGWSCIRNGPKRYMMQRKHSSLYLQKFPLPFALRSTIVEAKRIKSVCESMVIGQQLLDYDSKMDSKHISSIEKSLKAVQEDMKGHPVSDYICDEKLLAKLPKLPNSALHIYLQQIGFIPDKEKKLSIQASKCSRDMIGDFLESMPYWTKKWPDFPVLEIKIKESIKMEWIHKQMHGGYCSSTGVMNGHGVKLYQCVHPHCDSYISKFAIVNRSITKDAKQSKKPYQPGFPIVEPSFHKGDKKKVEEEPIQWEATSFCCERLALSYYDWRREQLVVFSPHAELTGTCAAKVFSGTTGELTSCIRMKTNAVALCFTPIKENNKVWGIGYSTGGNIGTYLLECWRSMHCPPNIEIMDEKKTNIINSEEAICTLLDTLPCIETGRYLKNSINSLFEIIKALAKIPHATPRISFVILKTFRRYMRALSFDIESDPPLVRKQYAQLLKSMEEHISKLPGNEISKHKILRVSVLSEIFPTLYRSLTERVNFVVDLYKNRTNNEETALALTERYKQCYAGIKYTGHFGMCNGVQIMKDGKCVLLTEKDKANIDYLRNIVQKGSLSKEGNEIDPALASLVLLMLMQQFHNISCLEHAKDSETFVVHKLLQLEQGDEVDVLDMGNESSWRPAKILAKRADKSLLIHYIGFDSKYDEWLSVGSGNIAPKGTKCRWPDIKSQKDMGKEISKIISKAASKTLFRVATSILSLCVGIADKVCEKINGEQKETDDKESISSPLPAYISELLMFSMFCIVRLGFENGQEETFELMRSCFALLKLGIQKPKIFKNELFILKRLLRNTLNYLFHNPMANYRVFGTDVKQNDLISKLLPVLELGQYKGNDVIAFLHKFRSCNLNGNFITSDSDYKQLDAASRLSVFFQYCVGQHSKVTSDGFCPYDMSFASTAEKSFAAAAIRLSSNIVDSTGQKCSLSNIAMEFAQSKKLLDLIQKCRQKSYRLIIFQRGEHGLPTWFRALVDATYLQIRKPIITALNNDTNSRMKVAVPKGDKKDKVKSSDSKAENKEFKTPEVKRKVITKTEPESNDGDRKFNSTNEGDQDLKANTATQRTALASDMKIPKHVVTMVKKWEMNCDHFTNKFNIRTQRITRSESKDQKGRSGTEGKQTCYDSSLLSKTLSNNLKWIGHFVKTAIGFDANKIAQWALHVESTFNGRLMFLRSVASFNLKGGENAAVVMIDEVFPQIWNALKNSESVKIFQPAYEGQMTEEGEDILTNFFRSIASNLSSYVGMKAKDLPPNEVLRFRMCVLLPFISADVSSRGVKMFLDSGIALELCRFALCPVINEHHSNVAAMAWRSFVHLIITLVSKSGKVLLEKSKCRKCIDLIVDVLQVQLKKDITLTLKEEMFADVSLTVGARRRAFVDSLKVGDIIDARTYSGEWRVGKIIRVKPSSVYVTWRGWVKETNENIFKDSGRLAPFSSRATLDRPAKDPDFHAPPFPLQDKHLRTAEPSLAKAFDKGNKAENREMTKYRLLNFKLFRMLDLLRILSSVVNKSFSLCKYILQTLTESVRDDVRVIPGLLQLEFVRFLQRHLPSCELDVGKTCNELFQLYSHLVGGTLPKVLTLGASENKMTADKVKDITEAILKKSKEIAKRKIESPILSIFKQRWKCVNCLKDNKATVILCEYCFTDREVSQPGFQKFFAEEEKKKKLEEDKKKKVAEKLKAEEIKRLKIKNEKQQERKKKEEIKLKAITEMQNNSDRPESHIFQSWTESTSRNNSNQLLMWSITDLIKTLLSTKSKLWHHEIFTHINRGVKAVPSTLDSLLSLSRTYESKQPLNEHVLPLWKELAMSIAALHMLGGYSGKIYKGSHVEVTLSHQLIRRGWVKTVSPKLVVELIDSMDSCHNQEVLCSPKDVSLVSIISGAGVAQVFGSTLEQQQQTISTLLKVCQRCLESSTLCTSLPSKETSSFLFKVCAQQLATGTVSVVTKHFLENFAKFRSTVFPCDLNMLMPLFQFAKSRPFAGSFTDTSLNLSIQWNFLLEQGMRTKMEEEFESGLKPSSYMLSIDTSNGTVGDVKLEKPLILQHVDTLCDLGFSKNMAQAALAATHGDLTAAGNLLTDNQVNDRDSSNAWKTCLRRIDAVDAVAAWKRQAAKEESMNITKWKGTDEKFSHYEIHLGSDILGKEKEVDSAFNWSKECFQNPLGLIVKFCNVDSPVRGRKFQVGLRVRAQDMHHEWYDAEIIEVKGDWVKLHYDKFDHFWDEWIDTKRQWRKLQIPGTKRVNAAVRMVDHSLPFDIKAGVIWKVSNLNPAMVLVKFAGDGLQPTHYIWSSISDLEPYISPSTVATATSMPGKQLSASLRALNETQLSYSLALLQRTISRSLLSHVGVSLSVLPILRRVQPKATNILHLLSCLANPWNWGDDNECSAISEPSKLLVQELARAIGVNILHETVKASEPDTAMERILKKQKETVDAIQMKKGVDTQTNNPSKNTKWDSFRSLLDTMLRREIKQLGQDFKKSKVNIRCLENGSFCLASEGNFSRIMVAFDRTFGGSPVVRFYSDKNRSRMLKKVSGAVPSPFAMHLPLYITVDRCTQAEGLSFLRRMASFTPLQSNSLDVISVMIELIFFLISHPWVREDMEKVKSLQSLLARALQSVLDVVKTFWTTKADGFLPFMPKMQILELICRLMVHQCQYHKLPSEFSICLESLKDLNLIQAALKETAIRYIVEIGPKEKKKSSNDSKDNLLSGKNNAKLSQYLLRSNYLVKHMEFLVCMVEYFRKFDDGFYKQLCKMSEASKEAKETPKKATPKPTEKWDCPACTYRNNAARTRCEMCGAAKPKSKLPKPKPVDKSTEEVARLMDTVFSLQKILVGKDKKIKEQKDSKAAPEEAKKPVFEVKSKIRCLDTVGNWTEAEIQEIKDVKVKVHYSGFDAHWDEWVDMKSDRIRALSAGTGDEKSGSTSEIENEIVESVCLLDLSLNSVWWPLFRDRLSESKSLDLQKLEGIFRDHEYGLTPLYPLAALLFKKETRLKILDAIIGCSTVAHRKLPEITVDTSNIVGGERRNGSGLFGQVKKQFKRLSPSQLRGPLGQYSWATRWKGGRNVGSEGLPGPFQQSMGMIWTELNERAQLRDATSPIILSPNGDLEIGDKDRDNLLLNPGLKSPSSFRCLGELLGCVLRSSSNCSLPFSRTVWKALTYGHYYLIRRSFSQKIAELESFDKNQSQQLLRIISQSKESFGVAGYTYTTSLSNRRVIELFPGGQNHSVSYEDRLTYVELVLNARLEENVNQTDMTRQGFLSVIPRYSQQRFQTELSPMCYLLTLDEIEERICGSPEIDLQLLRRKTSYKGVKEDSKHVKWFWNVLEQFSKEDRKRFIQFAWARSRLPHDMATNSNLKMNLNFTKTSDNALPKAQTCFFLVDMPLYSSEDRMREKLKMALNCDEINS